MKETICNFISGRRPIFSLAVFEKIAAIIPVKDTLLIYGILLDESQATLTHEALI